MRSKSLVNNPIVLTTHGVTEWLFSIFERFFFYRETKEKEKNEAHNDTTPLKSFVCKRGIV